MTFQYIIHHLDKPHSWFIVLTNPHTELNTKRNWNSKVLLPMSHWFQFGDAGKGV